MQNSKLAPQARPRALAELEVRIAEAERIRDRHYGAVSRLVAAGPGPTHEISHSRRRSSEGQDSHRNR